MKLPEMTARQSVCHATQVYAVSVVDEKITHNDDAIHIMSVASIKIDVREPDNKDYSVDATDDMTIETLIEDQARPQFLLAHSLPSTKAFNWSILKVQLHGRTLRQSHTVLESGLKSGDRLVINVRGVPPVSESEDVVRRKVLAVLESHLLTLSSQDNQSYP